MNKATTNETAKLNIAWLLAGRSDAAKMTAVSVATMANKDFTTFDVNDILQWAEQIENGKTVVTQYNGSYAKKDVYGCGPVLARIAS